LETTYLLFKDHPNRSNITIIVEPDLRETLRSPAGIGIPGVMGMYSAKFNDFKAFDTSQIKRDDWYLQNLDEESYTKIERFIKEKPCHDDNGKIDHTMTMLNYIIETGYIEKLSHVKQRIKEFKENIMPAFKKA